MELTRLHTATELHTLYVQERARAYCDRLRGMPDVWQLCMQRFGASGFAEVQFWCLQTLQQASRLRARCSVETVCCALSVCASQSLDASFASISGHHQDLVRPRAASRVCRSCEPQSWVPVCADQADAAQLDQGGQPGFAQPAAALPAQQAGPGCGAGHAGECSGYLAS